MGLFLYAFLVLTGVLAVYLIVTYLDLIEIRKDINNSKQEIDALILQRDKEFVSLVGYCREHLSCGSLCDAMEQASKQVRQLHTHSSIDRFSQAENELRTILRQFFQTAREQGHWFDNAEFKNLYRLMVKLQFTISERREFYNDLIHSHNQKISSKLVRMMAKKLQFTQLPSLDFAEDELPSLVGKGVFAS